MQKHPVDFADAGGVSEDKWALTLKDKYRNGEQRYASLGLDFLGRLMVVVYVYRDTDLRIISARRATRRERRTVEQKRA